MKRAMLWVVGIVGALLVLVVLGVTILAVNIDGALKHAIEYGGTYALGVETTIDDADLEIFNGRLTLTNLKVANPEGFSDKPFMLLKNAQVQVLVGSLMSDLVEVPLVTIDGFDVSLEVRENKNNYDVILASLERFSSGETAEPAEPSTTVLAVDRISIKNVRADADVKLGGSQQKSVTVKLEPIELSNFRSDGDQGPMMAQLTSVITRAILGAVARHGVELLPSAALGQLQNGLSSVNKLSKISINQLTTMGSGAAGAVKQVGGAAGDAVKGAAGAATGAVQGAAGTATDAAKKVTGEAGNQLKKIGSGVGGLLGGKKEEEKVEEQAEEPPADE
ncbi:MAG: hypothetical protein RIG82_07855 [Phycisphaeraceae bacterium]